MENTHLYHDYLEIRVVAMSQDRCHLLFLELHIFKVREILAILGLKIGLATWISVAPAARLEV